MAGTDFEKAVESVGTLTKDPGNDTKLRLYALYKQATLGDADGRRPGFTNPVGRAKYDAWAKLTGTSREQAEADYVAEANRLTGA
ncbi:acyl-CoA-binding protein [Knoellia sp. Soil729]|uniref:acyl-CoA-binding protein n=1 Tax=Knoellia sp. Soil729 TaxID=1736394 RepID=UPI0006FB9A39|nr:acyl-CoA-binding protein [Knoellia sp. Soil729]KRE44063.1 acyl-CoA-binding protein [Knoellia sp. Soil729]